MKSTLGWSWHHWTLFVVSGTLLVSVLALQMLLASRAMFISAPAVQVSEARLAPGTEGLLRQVALHLSKMQRGENVGGFPGFEPPKDDDEYRKKIKDQSFTARDVNDWVKEVNNFLSQIVQKNPGMSLREILQRQGLTPSQIDQFVVALRNAHATAAGMETLGVDAATIKTLESLMQVLGVGPW